MSNMSGRNAEQPEYLNDKDSAEDRQGSRPKGDDREADQNQENRKERVVDATISNTFGH